MEWRDLGKWGSRKEGVSERGKKQDFGKRGEQGEGGEKAKNDLQLRCHSSINQLKL